MTALTHHDPAAERREHDRERLEQAVRNLATSEGWQAWLRTRAMFHSYSFNNSMLIASQRPTATHIAGFRTWQKLNRQVRKGERSIRIFAPRTLTEQDANGDDTRRVYFRSVPVFDIEQTDGEPLPEPETQPISGDSCAHAIPKLEQFAHEIGFTVHRSPLAENVGGYCDPREHRIVLNNNLNGANAEVRVLVHEVAHALGIGYRDHGRNRAEVLVESVTYIVCSSIGLDVSGASVPYIAGWDCSQMSDLRDFAQLVDTTARSIEEALAKE